MHVELNIRLIRGFAGRFIVPVIVLVLLSYYLYGFEISSKRESIGSHESAALARETLQFDQVFNNAISDLMILQADVGLDRIIAGDASAGREALASTFTTFCGYKHHYEQIRYIDATGREQVRVDLDDGRCSVTPASRLQDKASRYYFREAMRLAPYDIYVSPFDLNVENGRIERPFKPTIRFAIRVYDDKANAQGIVVLNYNGQPLLDAITRIAEGGAGSPMLLNAQGYWLKGLKPEDEWGFMFADHQQKSFARDYPDAWRVIGEQVQGQFTTPEGLFTYTTLSPLQQRKTLPAGVNPPRRPNMALATAENYYWKLVSFVPTSRLSGFAETFKQRLMIADGAMIFIWALVSFMLSYTKERERLTRKAMDEVNALTADIVESAFDGIIMIEGDGLIRSANPSACRMFGYLEEELLGREVSMLMPEPHRGQHGGYIQRYIETQEAHVIRKPRELEGVRKDGTVFPIELCLGAKEIEEGWRFTAIVRDITEQKRMAGRLELMAMTDNLTGVYNQGYFKRRLDEEYKRSLRYDLLLSLMILDIDHFKQINDSFGHLAGDQYLAEFSNKLQSEAREIDILARYGGEEFIIMMPQTNLTGASIFAERLRHAIEGLEVEFEGQMIQTTVSIGVAMYMPDVDMDPQSLLKRADTALYTAKQSGRNRVVMAKE